MTWEDNATAGPMTRESLDRFFDGHCQLDAHVEAFRVRIAVERRLAYELEPFADQPMSQQMLEDIGCIAGRVMAAAQFVFLGIAVPGTSGFEYRTDGDGVGFSVRMTLCDPDPDAPPWDFSY